MNADPPGNLLLSEYCRLAAGTQRWELAPRSRRRAPPTIIFWASLINLEFAAAFILSIETLDCRSRDQSHFFPGVSDLGPTTCMPLGQTFQCLRNCFMPVQTRR